MRIKNYRLAFFLLIITFSLVLVILGIVINVYFPYRPSQEEAVNDVQKLEGNVLPFPGSNIYIKDVKAIHVIGEIPMAQLVAGTYSEVDSTGVRPVTRCIFANYVTRHWLTGPRIYSSVNGGCKLLNGEGPPISMLGHQERGTYMVIGLPADERIASAEAHWLDGSVTTAAIVEDTFFFFRADRVEVEWVVGLDSKGRVLSDTLTANNDVHFSPLNYIAVRQVAMGDGVLVIGAYSLAIRGQECIEVTYLTAENARKFLTGELYFIGQGGCILNPTGSDAAGPSVSTSVEGDMVVSGWPLDEAIVTVRIGWSDGLEQLVPVEDGFYFARRPGTSAIVESITGLDAGGSVFVP